MPHSAVRTMLRRERALAALGLTSLALMVLALPASAQRLIAVDASIGVGDGAQRIAVSAWYPVATIADRLTLSGGVRLTSYMGSAGTFTNRGTVSGALTPTLALSPAVVGLAVAVQAELAVVGPLGVGFNIDLAGGALGADRTVGTLTATVQRGSLLLGGSPDVGALNSETYVTWAIAPTLAIRAGTSHYVTNYDVRDATGGGPTAKYQQFKTVPFVALRWRF